ncbi:MAG: hypothetical protein WC510_02110 [Candidatus Omnitrophota bacterium]
MKKVFIIFLISALFILFHSGFIVITNAEEKTGTGVVVNPAFTRGGTFTYKGLKKGELIQIGNDMFICKVGGDQKVVIGAKVTVGEGLIPLSNLKTMIVKEDNKSRGEFIEALIEQVGYYGLDIKTSAASALKDITGYTFGQDEKKWQEWWQKNKEKFGN